MHMNITTAVGSTSQESCFCVNKHLRLVSVKTTGITREKSISLLDSRNILAKLFSVQTVRVSSILRVFQRRKESEDT